MQHFDGTLEEAEPEGWLSMYAEPAQAPEDWSGSVGINEVDLPVSSHPLFIDWQNRIEMIEDMQDDLD